MKYIGIDPGLSGAVAVIQDHDSAIDYLTIFDTPSVRKEKGREYNVERMASFINSLLHAPYGNLVAVVGIEKLQVMHKIGGKQLFGCGRAMGLWEGLCAALHLPVFMVPPRDWKPVMLPAGSKLSDKDEARKTAQKLCPTHADLFERRKDDGRAEAFLIAEYSRRWYLQRTR